MIGKSNLAWSKKSYFRIWRLSLELLSSCEPSWHWSTSKHIHSHRPHIMQSLYTSKNHENQVLVPSPRCTLNCQALSIHLPPLGQGRNSLPGNDYISPPMSASWERSKFDDSCHHRSNGQRQYSLTPPSNGSSSRPTTSGKLSPTNARAIHANKTLGKDVRGDLSTPSSTDHETSGTALGLGNESRPVFGESNDDLSSNAQDSPEGQLVAGPPGIARRAKAHVPSACVNCKKKHLACETKRPCNRCVLTGKEVSSKSETSKVLKAFITLTAFRLVALMSNIRNEAGLAFEKKIAFERSLLAANTPMPNYTPAQTAYPILILAVVDQRHTESCVLSPRSPTLIADHGLLIPHTRNSLICTEPRHTRFPAPLTPSLMRIYQQFYSLLTSSWLNTTAPSVTLCLCRSQLDHRHFQI